MNHQSDCYGAGYNDVVKEVDPTEQKITILWPLPEIDEDKPGFDETMYMRGQIKALINFLKSS